MFNYQNRGISTLVAIGIIAVLIVVVGGGVLGYQYLSSQKNNNQQNNQNQQQTPNNQTNNTQPSITVISPNGGEAWARGSTHDIAWTSTGVNKITIWAWKEGASDVAEIITGTSQISASLGKYTWTIPTNNNDINLGGNFKVSISAVENQSIKDSSNNFFSIVAPTTTKSSITSIYPTSAPAGTTVTVYGNHFAYTNTGAGTTVWINNQDVFPNYVDNTKLTFVVPTNLPVGTYNLSVRTSLTPSGTNTLPFTVIASTNPNSQNSNGLLINARYGYQFNYDPLVFKVTLVGTKIDPTDYSVHIDTINLPNPGNPTKSCWGGNYVGESDFNLINTSSSVTTNFYNQAGLSISKTIKIGQQNWALFPGETNNSSLELISYNISNGSRNINIVFGCSGNQVSDQDRIKYSFMSKTQEDVWLKSVEDKLNQIVMTFKFTK